jgi:quinol monooxygenase YgiN
MIYVVATIEVAAGQRDALVELFRPLAPKVRAENGCLEYAVMIDTPSGLSDQRPLRPNALVVVEKWESLAALRAHLKTIHMAEYARQAEELQASVQLQVFEPV